MDITSFAKHFDYANVSLSVLLSQSALNLEKEASYTGVKKNTNRTKAISLSTMLYRLSLFCLKSGNAHTSGYSQAMSCGVIYVSAISSVHSDPT